MNFLKLSLYWALWFTFLGARTPIVSEVVFSGQKITKPYVIQRELQHPVGVPLDSALAADDRDRLENLGIFAGVTWEAIPLPDGTVQLHYRVVESFRFVGGPLPVYNEDTGWSLQFGLIINNFRGRDETLSTGGSVGGQRMFGLEFYDPWIVGDHVSLAIQTGRNVQAHLFLPYDVKTNSFEANIGRYFGYEWKTSLGFELEEKAFVNPHRQLDYRYFAPQGTFQYDTRDIYLEPTRGVHFVQSFYSLLYFTGSPHGSTTIWRHSYSLFHTLKKGPRKRILALNYSSRITLGVQDSVWLDYIGGAFTVRGWSIPSRVLFADGGQPYRFGQHYGTASVEIRQVIIPRYVTRFKTEFGLTIAFFIDAGLAGNTVRAILKEAPLMGTGFSFQIPWPVFGIIRFDYGWGFHNGAFRDRAFHFSFQQKF